MTTTGGAEPPDSESPGASPGAAGPLEGVRVVDLTRVLAGPYATMLLADLGAEVTKVERRGVGDDSRHIGPFIGEISAYFASLNRGKRSVALDLHDKDDRSTFDDLLAGADVLVENFRPGAMERLGYHWEEVHRRFPRIVYASVSGFGQTGPYRQRPAYDIVAQAMGGVMSITGHPGAPPTRVGSSIGDLAAGLFTTIGIVTALRHRDLGGEATHVDVAMLDSQVAILENAIARLQATGAPPGPLGSRHPSITPFAAYATADGYVIIACGNDELWAGLCGVLGAPELATDTRFATNRDRTDHADDVARELEVRLATAPTATWLERFSAAGIPSAPINDVADVLADPQVAARNMVVRIDDPRLGDFRIAGNPIKISGFADPATRGPVPDLPG